MTNNWRFLWVHVTVVLALLLLVMPLPAAVNLFRPDWPLLVLTYWVLALPHRISIGTAFVSVVAFIVAANYAKIRNFSILQQSLLIGLIFAFYHLLIFWLSHFLTGVSFRMAYLWPVLTSMALWPYIFLFLRRFRRKLKIQ